MPQNVIKAFVSLTVFFSLIVLLPIVPGVPLIKIFALSPWGINNFFVWQWVTQMFIVPSYGPPDMYYFFNFAIQMYFLWRIGNFIASQKGLHHTIALFVGSGIISGLVAYIYAICHGSFDLLFAGSSCAMYGLAIGILMLFHEIEFLLLLSIPVKGKWLILGFLGATLLINLSGHTLIHFYADFAAIIFSYLYTVIFWKVYSPFPIMHGFESRLMRLQNIFWKRKTYSAENYASPANKVYDFYTGSRILSDEDFIDACLSKIAIEGKASLNLRERFRLWRIARRKKRQYSK